LCHCHPGDGVTQKEQHSEGERLCLLCVCSQLCSFYNSFPAGCGQDRQGQPPATHTHTHTHTHCAPGLVCVGSEYCHDGLRPSVTQTALSQKAYNDIDIPPLSFSLSLSLLHLYCSLFLFLLRAGCPVH